jgi:hypothetical protein
VTRPRRWTAAVLLLPSLVAVAAERAATADRGAFELRSGVVVAPDRGAAYLMSPEGGIDAVDLGSGRVLWHASEAAKPLALAGDRLVAQKEPSRERGTLGLVVLDVAAAGKTLSQMDVRLPEGVVPAIDEGLGTSFEATGRADGLRVTISWRFSRREVGGATPAPGDAPAERQAEGFVLLDVDTGRVATPTVAPVPTSSELPERVARLVASGACPARPRRVGGVLALTDSERRDAATCYRLRRWDPKSGEPLAERTLFCGAAVSQRIAADGRHLMLTRRPERAAEPRAEYVWPIYDLETGAAVAEVPSDLSGPSFFVFDQRLAHDALPGGRRVGDAWVTEPLRLRVIDLRDGREVWARPIRDTGYRGPYPPTR